MIDWAENWAKRLSVDLPVSYEEALRWALSVQHRVQDRDNLMEATASTLGSLTPREILIALGIDPSDTNQVVGKLRIEPRRD